MVLLVRYGELSLKSPYVRRQLEDRLVANMQRIFVTNAVGCVVKRERGRLFVHAEDEAAAMSLLRRVFGIVSMSPARETSSALEKLGPFVADYARSLLKSGMTFAIRPARSGQHPYTSQDLGRVLGQAVRDAVPGTRVDLGDPDREIHVEVRGPRAYVFHQVAEGPGGLPLGSQGEVLAVAEDDAGMVATWLIMRRGCRARVAGREPFLAVLRAWDPKLEALAATPSELMGLAGKEGVPLVLPSRIDLTPPGETEKAFVLRPLAGLSDEEVERFAASIRSA